MILITQKYFGGRSPPKYFWVLLNFCSLAPTALKTPKWVLISVTLIHRETPSRQNMNYDAIAIGAGLSGCSAAIQLAKLGYRVLLLEQSHYPMHKLCGEFLSVEVTAAFEHLGILEQVHKIG
ncbi:MAG: FAD-dependent oxidoreductase, partial [Pseudanabaena sp.]